MKVIALVIAMTILAFPGLASHAQADTPTPTPTETPMDTPTLSGTATNTPTPTIDPQSLYQYATLAADSQQTAIIYTFTAGELLNAVLEFCTLAVVLFIALLLAVRRER